MYIRILKAPLVNKWNQKRRVMRRYDLTATKYDARYNKEQRTKYQATLEHIDIAQHRVVLDVGCGTGLFFGYIATNADTVVATDISRLSLIHAKKRARDFHNVHLVQADADYLPFKDNYFNLIFAFTILQNMPMPADTLKEFKRNKKPGAYVVVTGLKKTFQFEDFRELLHNSGLQAVYLEEANELKCFIALTV
jgi:ubiquinone/menaquinone biosynthesis C-methylase UbiE